MRSSLGIHAHNELAVANTLAVKMGMVVSIQNQADRNIPLRERDCQSDPHTLASAFGHKAGIIAAMAKTEYQPFSEGAWSGLRSANSAGREDSNNFGKPGIQIDAEASFESQPDYCPPLVDFMVGGKTSPPPKARNALRIKIARTYRR